MIKINLLPYHETEKKENLKRQIIIIAASFAVVILLLLSTTFYISSSIGSLEKKVQTQEEQLAVLKKKMGDIEVYKRDIRELEQKLAVITSLEQNRFFPVRLLGEMAALVPTNDIWLVTLSETNSDLRIDGVARNNVIVADFMKKLQRSDVVTSVNLMSTRQADFSGLKLQQFTLACVLKKG